MCCSACLYGYNDFSVYEKLTLLLIFHFFCPRWCFHFLMTFQKEFFLLYFCHVLIKIVSRVGVQKMSWILYIFHNCYKMSIIFFWHKLFIIWKYSQQNCSATYMLHLFCFTLEDLSLILIIGNFTMVLISNTLVPVA